MIVPLGITVGLLGFLLLGTIERQVEKQMQKDLELVARAVKLPLSYAMERDRMGSIQQALESVFAIGRIYSAYVYSNEGREIFRLGRAEPEPQRDRLVSLAAKGQQRGEYGRIADRPVFSYFVPLTDMGGQVIGLLQLTRKESEFSENLARIRRNGVVILVMALATLAAVALYGHHRALGRHLERLTASMSKIAHGERHHRYSCRGPREILQIGETFNHMLDSIDGAHRTIMAHRRHQEKLEGELRHAEKLAALGRLAAGAAHELGTPLSVVSGKAQRGLRERDLSDHQRHILTAIRDEVGRMDHIIRQLLDFSRRNPLRCTAIKPGHLAASTVATLAAEARNSGTHLDCGVGNGGETQILLDTVRVQQALTNLVRNAIQSTPGGRVRVRWQQKGDEVGFRVEDDGPGVPPDERSRIFEPFYTTKGVGDGTGLGLAVVYAVAQEHGGRIVVGESPMGGAAFHLTLRSQSG
jgi:signal transduction histidine kinase